MNDISTTNLNALVNYARMTIDSEIFLLFSPDYLALALLENEVLEKKSGFITILAESKNYLSLEEAIDEIYSKISQ